MLDLGFKDKRALLVGAGPGMGRSAGRILADGGAQILCVDLVPANAEASARELGASAHPVVANAANPADVDRVVAEAVRIMGGIDICIDVVGAIDWADVTDTELDTWDRMFDVNLRQAFVVSRAVGRLMVKQGTGGSFAFVSSVSGHTGAPAHAAYGAAKRGLESLSESIAVELGPHGVRANVVAPGTIATPEAKASQTAEYAASLAKSVPLGVQGSPDDIGAALAFLVSDRAAFITGQVLTVDGGAEVMHSLPIKPAVRPESFRHEAAPAAG